MTLQRTNQALPSERLMCTATRLLVLVMVLATVLAVGACGGGGGSSRPAPPTNPPPAPTPQPPTQAELRAAALLASQATTGATYDDIVAMAEDGASSWINQQIALPVVPTLSGVDALIARREAGEFAATEDDIEYLVSFRRYVMWDQFLQAPDVLRQRVALALSEILVVSDNVDTLIVYPAAMATYWDTLLTHSFGNFRSLLKEVTLHPAMGVFLSHINNRKADPVANTFPDENFAREVMQLFTIGLFELNLDGSLKRDAANNPIPTYNNNDIREFAKIFTGLSFGGPGAAFGTENFNFRAPMQMFDAFHEPGAKTLLGGTLVPTGQTGAEDIDAAIDNLFNHPNVGPFIGRLLIQRLVKSNPSTAYVRRVAQTFNNNGSGVRGDMAAVVRAILLDTEAAASDAVDAGKLREPMLRYASIVRALKPESDDGRLYNSGFFLQQLVRQHPLSSPSVFNFFLPDHSPAGELADAGLVAPELQLTTSTTIAGVTNLVDFVVTADFTTDVESPPFAQVRTNLQEYEDVAGDAAALLDRLDLVFTSGRMSTETRDVILPILEAIDDLTFRTRTALYLVLISPDHVVQS